MFKAWEITHVENLYSRNEVQKTREEYKSLH